MNDQKKLAIGLALGFVIGVIAGQAMPQWSTKTEPVTAAPADHSTMSGHGGNGEMTAASVEGLMMECAKERPELEARLQKNPQDVEALLALGACDLDIGDSRQGLSRLSQAAVLTNDPKQLIQAGISFTKVAETEKAFASFEKALLGDPRDSEALYRAGLLAFHNMGDNQKAAQYWKRYLEVAPDAPNAELIRRAVEHIASGQSPSAH